MSVSCRGSLREVLPPAALETALGREVLRLLMLRYLIYHILDGLSDDGDADAAEDVD